MTGLVGWWPLHEDSGSTARDLSGNGNHGSLNGGVTQGIAGKGGLTAYSFDGSDDAVEIDNIGFSQNDPATLTAWVNTKGSDNGLFIGDSYRIGISYGWKTSGDYEFRQYDNNNGNGQTLITYNGPTSEWVHLALSYDGSTLYGYVNGNQIGSKSSGGWTPKNQWDLGARTQVGDMYIDTLIADARVYNRKLSSSEIQTLYEWGSGDYTAPILNNGNDSGAVSRWRFDNENGNSSEAVDFWGSNQGGINGASYVDDSIRGKALDFDRNNQDYVGLPDENGQYPAQSFTLSAWIKTSDGTEQQAIQDINFGASSIDNNNGGILFCLGTRVPERKIGLTFITNDDQTQDAEQVVSGSKIENNVWYHVVGVRDASSGTASIYINGVQENIDSTNTGDIIYDFGDYDDDSVNIGAYIRDGFDARYFKGKIDDVRIYDRALEPHEVFQLYQWGTRGRDMGKLTVNQR